MRTENTDTKTNPFSVIVNDYKLDKLKVLQTHHNRSLLDEFKIICKSKGKNQREVIEEYITSTVENYRRGEL